MIVRVCRYGLKACMSHSHGSEQNVWSWLARLTLVAMIWPVVSLPASAEYTVTRLTPDFNPGSLPHLNSTALHLPVDVDAAPGNTDLYFVSQLGGLESDGSDGDDITKSEGRIVLLDRNTGQVDFNNPFLVIGDTNTFDPVAGAPEVGLFSTAFHPDFATNGKFYVGVAVNYPGPAPDLSPRDPRNPPFKFALREYTADPNNLAAGASFSQTILEIDQPSFNHNGSWLGFNPVEVAQGENYLYVTMGDGGDQHDPYQYGQDKDHLLGTVMRIDIDGDDFVGDPDRNYAIPADNPFVGSAGLGEIWAYGFRNPWRAGFDSLTGDLFVGDVGQFTWEEINYIPGDISPTDDRNYGWRLREGFVATPSGGVGGSPPADNVDPIVAYAHGGGNFQGNSVAGGIVYRGPVPEFYGKYIFADSISGNIWAMDVDDIGTFDPLNPGDTLQLVSNALAPEQGNYVSIVSFAEDEAGNLLIVDHGFDGAGLGGHIYRLDLQTADFNSDGVVNGLDFLAWQRGESPNPLSSEDLTLWEESYDPGIGRILASEVPEPTTAVMALGMFAALLAFSRVPLGRQWAGAVVATAITMPAVNVFAVTPNQVDDFQDGTVQGWGPGFANVAFNALDAGPQGTGDHALLIWSDSDNNPITRTGSRSIGINTTQWLGDWTAAGITTIDFEARNPNDFPITLWLGIAGPVQAVGSAGTGDTYTSLTSATLAVNSGWQKFSIPVTSTDFQLATNHTASGNIVVALTDVGQFRIFHNSGSSNNFIGDQVPAQFYLDNITAVAVPEPGTMVLASLAVLAGYVRRRR